VRKVIASMTIVDVITGIVWYYTAGCIV